MSSIGKYFSLVKFAHTIFALPFAMLSFTYAVLETEHFEWRLLVLVLLCMVFARNVAMGFNRWADREIDARNPRTASREIPSGEVKPSHAMVFVVINALLFVFSASLINTLTAFLSPVALFVVLIYSYCKRFTSLAHLVLGLSLGIAPSAAYISVTGTLTLPPCILSLVVIAWCSGFDIIYALQDREFDIKNGLKSIPSRFSVKTSLNISILLHTIAILSLFWYITYLPVNLFVVSGFILFSLIVIWEHILVTPKHQKNIGIAFGTMNGLASLSMSVLLIAGMLYEYLIR